VTGPTKTGYVGINYTPSHNWPFPSAVTEYLWCVTYTIKPIKCLIRVANLMAIGAAKKRL